LTGKEVKVEDMIQFRERRRYPRTLIDLPLEYQIMDVPYVHGGLVVNVSETGLLIYSTRDMPVGLRLHIAVLFPRGYELTHFDVTAEILRKDFSSRENSEGYVYGLRFIQMLRDDHSKLKELLAEALETDEEEEDNGKSQTHCAISRW